MLSTHWRPFSISRYQRWDRHSDISDTSGRTFLWRVESGANKSKFLSFDHFWFFLSLLCFSPARQERKRVKITSIFESFDSPIKVKLIEKLQTSQYVIETLPIEETKGDLILKIAAKAMMSDLDQMKSWADYVSKGSEASIKELNRFCASHGLVGSSTSFIGGEFITSIFKGF